MRAFVLLLCALLLATCSFPGSVKPTVKIGLSAPFEGRDRDLGYQVLHAVRLAVRQRNEGGGVGDRYLVELVALNDFNEAESAVVQARKMAVDLDIMAVIGGWSPEAAHAAGSRYQELGLPFVPADGYRAHPVAGLPQEFAALYQTLSGGAAPEASAQWAYVTAVRVLDAIDEAARQKGRLDRARVAEALEPLP